MSRCAITLGIAMTMSAAPAGAGFLDPVGRTQVITTLGYSTFSRQFDAKGQIKRSSRFTKSTSDTRVSHGLNQSLTLIAELSGERLMPEFVNAPGATSNWFVLAGARALLWRGGNWVVSAQALAGGGREDGRSGFTGDARLAVGRNFTLGGMVGFADVQAGYRHPVPGQRPEFRLDATLGVRPHEKWLLLAQVFAAQGLAQGGLPNSLRIKAQLGVVWDAGESWSVQASGFTTVHGVNAAQETGASLALWRRF